MVPAVFPYRERLNAMTADAAVHVGPEAEPARIDVRVDDPQTIPANARIRGEHQGPSAVTEEPAKKDLGLLDRPDIVVLRAQEGRGERGGHEQCVIVAAEPDLVGRELLRLVD